jgi:hypothetical protein
MKKEDWIEVSKHLPELYYIDDNWSCSKTVLITDGDYVKVAHYEKFFDKVAWSGFANLNPTHWMEIVLP